MESGALLELAVGAARRAGELLLERWRGPERGVGSKSSPTDLVSDADRDAETLLIELIRDQRPDDGIVGEESGETRSSSGMTWVLDPLDGTVDYLFGIPVWAVSIAVEDRDGGLIGVINDPNRAEMFTAARGEGARLNDSHIEVSDGDELSTALIGTGFSYESEARAVQATILQRVLPRVRDIRRAGSAALDLAWVACGRLDGVYEAPMERWDKAAGLLIVSEAGGVTSELAPPLPHLSPGVIASGPRLHEELRRLVARPARPDPAAQARH